MLTFNFSKHKIVDSNGLMLDVGCGEGRHIFGVMESYPQMKCIGIDPHKDSLKKAEEGYEYFQSISNAGAEFMEASAYCLPFPDETFDLVVCSEVLEHLHEYIDAVKEIKRVLKKGGKFYASVPASWPEKICWALSKEYQNQPGGHLRIFNQKDLVTEIEGVGFNILSTEKFHSIHSAYWWLRCLFWKTQDSNFLVKIYKKMLERHILKKPFILDRVDKLLNPLMGKSFSMYFEKVKMYLPNIKFKKNITPGKDIFLRIAQSIKTNQLDSGAIPSNADLSHDPWDHIEAIMGLNFLNDKESSDLAFKWLKNNQNKDGSWYAKYSNNDPIELNKPTHFGPYISVAALHYYKIFSDKDKLLELWETIDSAIDFSLNLQGSNGTIPWSVDKNNQIEKDFLLTGASSILKSLECAIAISKILDLDANKKWTKAYESLAYAIKNPKGLFDKTIDRSRFSMDWYYPIISGVLSDSEKDKYIKKIYKDFYIEGIGVKCVVEEPWVTVAETSEFIVSLVISNEIEEAKKLLIEVMNISDLNDIPYMGWQYEENIFWPEEKPSWTAAALILAADSIYDFSSGSDILKENQL